MNKTTTTVTGIALAAAIGSTVFLSTEDNTAVTNEGHNLTDDIAAVQVDIPEIENIQLDIPKITSLHVNQEQITSLCDEEISAQEIPVITVSDPTADIPRYATIIGEQQMLLRDKRNIQHDPALNSLASTTWEAWKKIYQDPLYLDYIMEYKLYEKPNVAALYKNRRISKTGIRNDLRNYEIFMNFINAFMKLCGTNDRMLIDNFLWIKGKELYLNKQ